MSWLGSIFGGGSGSPYQKAAQAYLPWAQQGASYQMPFYNAGTQAMGNYQNWLSGMQNPTQFLNQTMNQYQQSPYAKFMQNQSTNQAQAAASASGMLGSTPLMQQIQQNSQNISSQDQQNWLQNALGINSQYGQGQQELMGMGQHSADELSGIYSQIANSMGQAAFGQQSGKLQDRDAMLSSIFGSMFFS